MEKQIKVYQQLAKDFDVKGEDHWHFETSPHEKKRFKKLLEYANSVPHASILEIGCAEGHFTQMLQGICTDITAIDVTPLAIERARKRVKGVDFRVGAIEELKFEKKFDLVICSEVFYYMLDKKKALDKIQSLGKFLLANDYMCFPIYKDGIKAELSLLRFRPVRWTVVITLQEKRVATVGIWKLS
jgi:2-polyprenyl-3-methyl-5-hydroxy-6-metoxy-1,4-benzoquinol methylase